MRNQGVNKDRRNFIKKGVAGLAGAAVLPSVLRGEKKEETTLEERAKWISENAIVFETEKAGAGFEDLQPLKEVIGDARIVALGEGTHGTREFFRMKHRITEFLAKEMGFTLFSIEANMPEIFPETSPGNFTWGEEMQRWVMMSSMISNGI